jgi:hypothetical protein
MEIRIKETGQVMLEDEFRSYQRQNGGPTWGATTTEVLEALGADVVFEGPQASPTRYQVAFRDGVEQIEGKWYTKHSVADMDADAKAAKDAEQAKSVRITRDAKLAESDWRVIKALESNTPQDFEWASYRQALRDVPNQVGFPWEVVWPTQPE